MNSRTKKITMVAMLCAITYVVMAVAHMFPLTLLTAIDFLKYDPKDVIIAIGGFLFGPLAALAISLIVGFFEMITVSTTGIIGLIMNVGASAAFACPAAMIYRKKRTFWGAMIGLMVGTLSMTALMLLWNYWITPMYLGVEREVVVAMMLPGFLPFNLLKGGINMVVTILLYKPIVMALRKAKLVDPRS